VGGDGMNLLTLTIILPLAGVLALVFSPRNNIKAIKMIALGTSVVTLISALSMLTKYKFGVPGFQLVMTHSWFALFNVNYAVGIDGLALVLILLTAILVPIVIVGGWHEADAGRWSVKTYYLLILVLETLMVAVFAATDIFLFYVIFEVMLIPVYFLIGGYGRGDRAAAALKFLLYSLFGGLLMLAAVIGIFVLSVRAGHGSFDVTILSHLKIGHQAQDWLFLGFFIAFAIKAPLFPFHTWLPGVAKSATPGTSILVLGVLDKVGTYGMIRFCLTLFPDATKTFAPYIIVLALFSIIYGAFLAIGQKDLNSLIAFTSISHFGFIVLGIFALTSQGITGASLYMVNHGFSTAALFLVGGWMVQRRKSSQIEDFGGLQRITPVMAWCFFIAGLSALALPGLSSFVSEFLVLIGTFTRYPAAAVIGTLGIVLAALYVLILVQRSLHGPLQAGNEDTADLNLREKVAIAPVIVALVFLGFYPKPAIHIIDPATSLVLSQAKVSDPTPLAGK
jgi:NADH-quinone oxidoreductase subunit M